MYNLQSNQFILTQSENYVVYSEYESVFLKDKSNKEIKDMPIASHYGDPTGALILHDETHVIVSGCGLSIYTIESKKELHILNEPDKITWTNGLYEDGFDNDFEFRFVAANKEGQLRVFKMNVLTSGIVKLQ